MLVYVIAGEASSDALGAAFMRSMRARYGDGVRFAGVGGEQMTREGLSSLFPISEMAVMGVFEILPYARHLLKRIAETAEDILKQRPAILLTIDSKAFTFRVVQRVRAQRAKRGVSFPLVHMVPPTVWAWRPGRARVIAKFLDHLLCLFPFEPPYFERHGLPTTFVGHPSALQPEGNGARFRARHGIEPDAPVLLILPGSRPGEVRRLIPVFGPVVDRIVTRYPGMRVVVPTVPVVADAVRRGVADWRGEPLVVDGTDQKFDAFAAGTAALAASGTVTLELSLAGVPTVVAYRVGWLSAIVAKMLVNRDSVILTNRLLEKQILPLYVQEECQPDTLTIAVQRLIDDKRAREEQIEAGREIREKLIADGEPPADRMARVVASLAGLDQPPAAQP